MLARITSFIILQICKLLTRWGGWNGDMTFQETVDMLANCNAGGLEYTVYETEDELGNEAIYHVYCRGINKGKAIRVK